MGSSLAVRSDTWQRCENQLSDGANAKALIALRCYRGVKAEQRHIQGTASKARHFAAFEQTW